MDSKTTITIINVRSYSKASKYEIIYRMFSPEPVNLELFAEETQSLIKAGQLGEGMTRYQTLLARGYPPAHRTPSLQSDQWVYWSSRHQSDVVNFVDGRLVAAVDIEQPPSRVPLPRENSPD